MTWPTPMRSYSLRLSDWFRGRYFAQSHPMNFKETFVVFIREWSSCKKGRNCESELVIDSRISSPGQCGVRRSGTAVWKGELEGTGELPCGAKDKAKTQKETESLLMSVKQFLWFNLSSLGWKSTFPLCCLNQSEVAFVSQTATQALTSTQSKCDQGIEDLEIWPLSLCIGCPTTENTFVACRAQFLFLYHLFP